jgi:hypothetical protein
MRCRVPALVADRPGVRCGQGAEHGGNLPPAQIIQLQKAEMGNQVGVDVMLIRAQGAGPDAGAAGLPVPQPSGHCPCLGSATARCGGEQQIAGGHRVAAGGVAAARRAGSRRPWSPATAKVEVPAAVTPLYQCRTGGDVHGPPCGSRHPRRLNSPPLSIIVDPPVPVRGWWRSSGTITEFGTHTISNLCQSRTSPGGGTAVLRSPRRRSGPVAVTAPAPHRPRCLVGCPRSVTS